MRPGNNAGNPFPSPGFRDDHGAAIVLVTLLMVVFMGVTALAVDVGHLYVVRNELQNAADAGALRGARVLYDEYGTAINPNANQEAYTAATQNRALAETGGGIPVDVNYSTDVQRGHWSFATRTFTPNDSLVAVNLWGVTTEELDADPDFINAIRVVARRETTPAASFFAKIFGYENFKMAAEAVGYIGFAGTLAPGEVDLPVAICRQSLTNDSSGGCDSDQPYDCNIGYMISDGQDKNTAAWSNFSQPCETASTTSIRPLMTCTEANPNEITLGNSMGTTNGVNNSVLDHPTEPDLRECWANGTDAADGGPIDTDGNGVPDQPWNLTLPVIDCPDFQVGNCQEPCGAVNVNIIWITGTGEDPSYEDAPYEMAGWSNDSEDGSVRWNDFVNFFNLVKADGTPATYSKKSIYFLPDCTPHDLKGLTGGHNFGVLAEIPVLVK